MRSFLLFQISNPYLEGSEDKLPTEFRLFQYGVNKAYHMGGYHSEIQFDQVQAKRLCDDYLECGHDIPIDWDHSMLSDDPRANKGAAGWFKPEMRDDGLYAANVMWSTPGAEKLRSKEYRYFSPSVEFDVDDDGNYLGMSHLLPAALTNIPALKQIQALINNSLEGQNLIVDKKDTKMSTETETLELAAKRDSEELAKARAEIQELKINALLEKAILEGRLEPAKKAQFAALGKKDLEALTMSLSILEPKLNVTKAVEKTESATSPQVAQSTFSAQAYALLGGKIDIATFNAKVKESQHALQSSASYYSTPIKIKLDKAREGAKQLKFFVGIK